MRLIPRRDHLAHVSGFPRVATSLDATNVRFGPHPLVPGNHTAITLMLRNRTQDGWNVENHRYFSGTLPEEYLNVPGIGFVIQSAEDIRVRTHFDPDAGRSPGDFDRASRRVVRH